MAILLGNIVYIKLIIKNKTIIDGGGTGVSPAGDVASGNGSGGGILRGALCWNILCYKYMAAYIIVYREY